MNDATRQTARPPTLREFCELAELEDEARSLLRDGWSAHEYFTALVEAGHHADAVRFLAFALPRREAVWWAWSCVRRTVGEKASPATRAALDIVEHWVREPTDDHRRAAMPAAEAADLGTPAGCAALAVFLSGGSIAPRELETVEPPPGAGSQAIAGSVILAAVTSEPEKADEKFQAFIELGRDVAERVRLWQGH